LNLLIRRLREVLVPPTDGLERLRRDGTDDIVNLGPHLFVGLRRRRWNSNDNPSRMQLPQRRDGGMHGGSGRQTVVNQNHSAIADVEGWPAAAIKTLAACEFLSLADRNSIDQMVWNAKTIHS
jgi:hypothetical protein